MTKPFAKLSLGIPIFGNPDIIIRDAKIGISIKDHAHAPVSYTSAKVVLIGESNVGKSCLALRLTTNNYEEQGCPRCDRRLKISLSAQRCIIVPGNHDLNWDLSVYNHMAKRAVEISRLPAGSYVEQERVYLIRDDTAYPKRFENFMRFYHQFTQQEYPLSPEKQGFSLLFEETGIQFLAMNSSWQIDEYFPIRSSINEACLANALLAANGQIDSAVRQNRMDEGTRVLRIAVWHHPVTGNDKIVDDDFLERLKKADFKLCLHGHVHEERADVIGYLHPTRKIYIAGAGSFGVVAAHRPVLYLPRGFTM